MPKPMILSIAVIHGLVDIGACARCQANTISASGHQVCSTSQAAGEKPSGRDVRTDSGAKDRARRSAIATLKATDSTVADKLGALQAISGFRLRDLTALVHDVAQNDASDKVRRYAKIVLKQWRRDKVADVRSQSEQTEARRRMAMTAAERQAKEEATRRASILKRRDEYMQVLRAGTLKQRRAVAQSAIVWANYIPEAIPVLRDIVLKEKDYVLRLGALAALDRHGGDEAIPLFRACLNAKNEEGLRQQAACYLARRGKKEGIATLIDLLKSERALNDPWFGVVLNSYLERFTKQDFGYPSCHPNPAARKPFTEKELERRDKAIASWHAWWNQVKATFTPPVPHDPTSRPSDGRTRP